LRTVGDLLDTLRRLDGRSYHAYKQIAGSFQDDGLVLQIDHVQGDPFADPSRVRVVVDPGVAGLPAWALSTDDRRRACADLLNRRLCREADHLGRQSHGQRGSGKSGEVRVQRPGQAVLTRSSLVVRASGEVEARFQVGLPAAGRRVLGRAAASLLGQDVPDAIDRALLYEAIDPDTLRRWVETVEDAVALRAQLGERGLVAFVADGAVLPRASGVDDRPLDPERAVEFEAPPELAVELTAPNAGALRGLGVPRGVTLIVGGGFHGKSTLLRALERGVYDHVPGDGRERVVCLPDAVKVRAEDGRAVSGVDISNFIDGLPDGQDTSAFQTPNASGSTSQAAAIVEALELGATCLLMDEDTSATNLLIRDARMQALVADEREPITPYLDHARGLAERGVSTVLVLGGSGDYLDVADNVIALDAYRPRVVTAAAHEVALRIPSRRATGAADWRELTERGVVPSSLDPRRGRRSSSIKVPAPDRLLFGEQEVRVHALEQLVEQGQVRALGHALAWMRGRHLRADRPLSEALAAAVDELTREGLEVLDGSRPGGDLVAFRIFELGALLGRLRGLRTVSLP
jgi:predicted ABC-class ATPase